MVLARVVPLLARCVAAPLLQRSLLSRNPSPASPGQGRAALWSARSASARLRRAPAGVRHAALLPSPRRALRSPQLPRLGLRKAKCHGVHVCVGYRVRTAAPPPSPCRPHSGAAEGRRGPRSRSPAPSAAGAHRAALPPGALPAPRPLRSPPQSPTHAHAAPRPRTASSRRRHAAGLLWAERRVRMARRPGRSPHSGPARVGHTAPPPPPPPPPPQGPTLGRKAQDALRLWEGSQPRGWRHTWKGRPLPCAQAAPLPARGACRPWVAARPGPGVVVAAEPHRPHPRLGPQPSPREPEPTAPQLARAHRGAGRGHPGLKRTPHHAVPG